MKKKRKKKTQFKEKKLFLEKLEKKYIKFERKIDKNMNRKGRKKIKIKKEGKKTKNTK
jgi:hypothetical protein